MPVTSVVFISTVIHQNMFTTNLLIGRVIHHMQFTKIYSSVMLFTKSNSPKPNSPNPKNASSRDEAILGIENKHNF